MGEEDQVNEECDKCPTRVTEPVAQGFCVPLSLHGKLKAAV